MQLQSFGAALTVTGSMHLLTSGGRQVLIDCGLFQGLKELRERNWQPLPVDPPSIDAIILTHAHLDHCGYLPRLVSQGFKGRVFCTAGTRDLCTLVLPDSAHIQEEDARDANRHHYSKHHPALPLYTSEDAERALTLMHPVGYNRPVPVVPGVEVEFINAGHLLGSAFARVRVGARTVLFGGDLGRYGRPVLPDPTPVEQADVLLLESTYGDRVHQPDDRGDRLAEIVTAVAARGGKLIIPAFAIGRVEEIIYWLRRLEAEHRIPTLPVVVDSPMAAKALRPLPVAHKALSEDTRVRQRYVDLIMRPEARAMPRTRAATVAALRRGLDSRGFLEIETPMLQTMHGGATARPFITTSNAFDLQLFLRIAPELFLKRAVVGGIERVFEINRNFRNEGADSSHSPEFAMLEFYQAYADYRDMATLTRELIQEAAVAAVGTLEVVHADGSVHDLSGVWPEISLYGSTSEALGIEITPATGEAELRGLCEKAGIAVQPTAVAGKLVEELFEHYVIESFKGRPVFVMDFPVDTSPLVRDHRSETGKVEKWDLYINGYEQATGYSELVDPVVQRQRLVEQAALGARGDVEAMRLDEDFLRALEYGMPPSGGVGLGIDRLLMTLTGLGIRETILFPLVKPER